MAYCMPLMTGAGVILQNQLQCIPKKALHRPGTVRRAYGMCCDTSHHIKTHQNQAQHLNKPYHNVMPTALGHTNTQGAFSHSAGTGRAQRQSLR